MTVEGNMLTIRGDLTKEFGPCSSGEDNHPRKHRRETISVADRKEKVGLNVYRKKA